MRPNACASPIRFNPSGVLTRIFAGQQNVQRMMKIIVPLRHQRLALATEALRLVVMVLQHHVHFAIAAWPALHAIDELIDEVRVAVVEHRVYGIDAQAIEAILLQPIKRVLDEELAHDRVREIDCAAPRRVMFGSKKISGITVQIIPFRAEVVVHHIDQHHQVALVRRLDETF